MALALPLSIVGTPLLAGAQSAPVPTCSVHGQITDEDGGAISHAFVLIHSDSGAKISQQVTLDPSGKFKMNLHRGLYALFVSSAGFVPVAQILDLRACKPLAVNLMMTFDSEHTDGDTF